jgi:Glycosyl transferase family 8
MGKSVLVALADRKYLNQARQLFATAFWNSGWRGDYLLLAHDIPPEQVTWFIKKGIQVKHCAPLDVASSRIGDRITASKCYLFSQFFKQWDDVVYLDVDIVTRGSIDGLTGLDGFSACYSLGQTLGDNLLARSKLPPEVVAELATKYDLGRKAFNSGVMAFPSSIIHSGMQAELLAVFNRYVKLGLFGGDQLPFNLYFYDRWRQLPEAYNQITPLVGQTCNTRKLQGLVIHCVSFGNGPWDASSQLHEEWLTNFKSADAIDLGNVPAIARPARAEVERRSKSVVNAYLMGGELNAANLMKLVMRSGRLALRDPTKLARKVRSLLK